jgi:transcriptional regulator with XRE-family HTH domain
MSESEHIPGRIKLARRMAGLDTQAALLQRIPEWKPSRLGNYEAGVSTPGPDDILKIASATETSACWLMFGLGPIRPSARDLQAIRHQNLCRLADLADKPLPAMAAALMLETEELQAHLDNPFQPIDEKLAKACEQYSQHRPGWMDEQHVEDDPLCMAFPEDMRELMLMYSGVSADQRRVILATIKALTKALVISP